MQQHNCKYCTRPVTELSTGGPDVCVSCEVHGVPPNIYMGLAPPRDFHAERSLTMLLPEPVPGLPGYEASIPEQPQTQTLFIYQEPTRYPFIVSGKELFVLNKKEDGSWVIEVNAAVKIEFKNDAGIVSDGNLVLASGGDTAMIAAGIHHVQPSGGNYYDSVMDKALGGDTKWRSLMERRAVEYAEKSEASRRREFYIRAAYRNAMNKRPKKSCGC